jgi:hypothetical protein
MPTTGAYDFKLSLAAKDGLLDDENLLQRGEWAWFDRGDWLLLYARCPDCGELATLYYKRGDGNKRGHDIDSKGNVSPSVAHSFRYKDVEQCGFHTQPTRLLDFVEKRTT